MCFFKKTGAAIFFLIVFLGGLVPLLFAQEVSGGLDYLKSTPLYRQALQGDRDSIYRLCLIFYYGDGKDYIYSDEDGKHIPVRDLRQAFPHCQTSANNGNTDALYHFGLLNLRDPTGDFRLGELGADRQAGLRAIRSAAEQGHILAQAEMAKLAENEREIIDWEDRAALGGHIPSQYSRNMRHFYQGNAEQQKRAVEWFLDFSRKNIGKFGIYAIGHIAEAYLLGKGGLQQSALRAYAYQSLFVRYYPSCQDSDSFRESLLAEYSERGGLNAQEIEAALDLARDIQQDIERRATARLQRPFSECR